MKNHKTIQFYRKRLPHWEVAEGLYFVTIRQAGSIPPNGIKRLKELSEELQNTPNASDNWRQRKVFSMLEKFLNASSKGDLLKEPYCNIVKDSIDRRNAAGKWRMVEYVIMHNHIHLFFQNNTAELSKVIKNFKRWTKTEFNRAIPNNKVDWQREWFDHWSRSADEDEKIIKYIRDNPVKAGFVRDYRDWPHGSFSRPSLDETGGGNV
jgi:REP element-mobilizing transposase RayT